MSNENTVFSSAVRMKEALESREISAEEVARDFIKRARSQEDLGIFLELDETKILEQAAQSDERRKKGAVLGPLDGIPVSIKDNICIKGDITSCASRILENFRSPYDASVIERLKGQGAVLFGRTNMDEFAMGSSTENSAFQITKNPWNTECVPGGSSGGAAASVAASCAPLALGSDTGGSIRQPAAFCGIFGVKPTYGRVSRYGLVAFASSLDQIGTFGRDAGDAALLLAAISGKDERDSTSHPRAEKEAIDPDVKPFSAAELKNLRVGISLPDKNEPGYHPESVAVLEKAVAWLQKAGAKVQPYQSGLRDYFIPIYYILATAEASSNLSRFDGIRYGARSSRAQDLTDLYIKSRTEGFGSEVKRRILLGAFVLSSGYYDAYYKSAQKARKMIQIEYEEAFRKVDVLLNLTTPTPAFRIGEKTKDPLAMYQSDLLTTSVNLGGVPALSFPGGLDSNGLPIGLQLTANHFNENVLFRLSATLHAEIPGFALDYARMKTREGGDRASSGQKTRESLHLISEKAEINKKNKNKPAKVKNSLEQNSSSVINGPEYKITKDKRASVSAEVKKKLDSKNESGGRKQKAVKKAKPTTVKSRTTKTDKGKESAPAASAGKSKKQEKGTETMGLKKKTKKKVAKKKTARKKVAKKKAGKKTARKKTAKKKTRKKVAKKKTKKKVAKKKTKKKTKKKAKKKTAKKATRKKTKKKTTRKTM